VEHDLLDPGIRSRELEQMTEERGSESLPLMAFVNRDGEIDDVGGRLEAERVEHGVAHDRAAELDDGVLAGVAAARRAILSRKESSLSSCGREARRPGIFAISRSAAASVLASSTRASRIVTSSTAEGT
jgi:hypothetical protein